MRTGRHLGELLTADDASLFDRNHVRFVRVDMACPTDGTERVHNHFTGSRIHKMTTTRTMAGFALYPRLRPGSLDTKPVILPPAPIHGQGLRSGGMAAKTIIIKGKGRNLLRFVRDKSGRQQGRGIGQIVLRKRIGRTVGKKEAFGIDEKGRFREATHEITDIRPYETRRWVRNGTEGRRAGKSLNPRQGPAVAVSVVQRPRIRMAGRASNRTNILGRGIVPIRWRINRRRNDTRTTSGICKYGDQAGGQQQTGKQSGFART